MATIENVPVFGKLIVQEACPEASATAVQLGAALPLLVNCTVPVAVLGLTMAMNRTGFFTTDGFLLESNFVEVVPVPPFTTCETVLLVLPV